jgi:uncharacterized protein YqeY
MLLDTINTHITEAMKAKDGPRLTTLRAIKVKIDAFMKERINRVEVTEANEQKILENLVKQRLDSIELFEKGKRLDLVAIERAELALIKSYMPKDATGVEIDAAIELALPGLLSTGPKAIGMVMADVKKRLAGKRVDGKILSEKIKARFVVAEANGETFH